jgi:NAD+-dependent protein deacetylase sirtuin 4
MMPLMRIPYTDPLPAPRIIPVTANNLSGAVAALTDFLTAPPLPHLKRHAYNRLHRHTHLVPRSAGAGHADPVATPGAPAGCQRNVDYNVFDSSGQTILLTGAGISVASGLADYRGTNGTYTLNKTYRPIYYHEFVAKHDARRRYWARSFLGWTNLKNARPNAAHEAVGHLGRLGKAGGVITQSM